MSDDFTKWEDLDPNTDTFTKLKILIKYAAGISVQFLRALARNTSYNWRHSDRSFFWENIAFNEGDEKDYDTERNYIGSMIEIWARSLDSPASFPWEWPDPQTYSQVYLKLSTDYQHFIGVTFDIKALSSGGVRVKGQGLVSPPRYLVGELKEMRSFS